MKSMILSGSLLVGEFSAHACTFLSRPPSEINAGVLIAFSVGLLLTLRHFTNAVFSAMTEHGETFTI